MVNKYSDNWLTRGVKSPTVDSWHRGTNTLADIYNESNLRIEKRSVDCVMMLPKIHQRDVRSTYEFDYLCICSDVKRKCWTIYLDVKKANEHIFLIM